jgi:hypothetical protein
VIASKNNAKTDPSLPDQYAYWLIPNAQTTPPSDFQLLIQKDRKSRKERIDPAKTTLIMKMQTDDLGEIAIELKVNERKLDVRVNTDNESSKALFQQNFKDFLERMKAQNFNVSTWQVLKRVVDVKKFIMPELDLDGLTRVRTSV